MGKFQLRKPKIISKNFPEVGSHIDNVSKSLNDLVFSYSAQVDRALQKKHMMMALSTLVLILVVGNFISPKGKADIATFYPDTCLGGWSNPQNAQKEPETTTNADASEFNDKNSAILDKSTHADIYCGNFNGKFDEGTQPTKVIVSFAMTNKDEITIGTVSTSTLEVVATSTATSTDLQATSTELLQVASSSNGLDTEVVGSTSDSGVRETDGDTQVSTTTKEKEQSFVDIVTEAVSETISNLMNSGTSGTTETDTVVVPAPQVPPVPQEQNGPVEQPTIVPTTVPENTPPTSYMDSAFRVLSTFFITTVFAQEEATVIDQPVESVISNDQTVDTATSAQTSVTSGDVSSVATETLLAGSGSTTEVIASTTSEFSTSTATSTDSESLAASSSLLTDITTATSTSMTEVTDTQNNFLEVLYTFDGVTWISLGELNEISMKYRTFEIPLSASSTWSDMSQLQIKVAAKTIEKSTPVVYLDAIKVDVLYESTLAHPHPDFVRDTILKDETVDGVRLVTIINNEINEEETWYMYLDEGVDVATSTPISTSSSTNDVATTTDATSTDMNVTSSTSTVATVEASSSIFLATTTATSTDAVASAISTSTAVITPTIIKNKWFKLEKKEGWSSLSVRELVVEIKKMDKEELERKIKEDRLPKFDVDIIKRIKGTLFNKVIVQIIKDGNEELWLYDLGNSTERKIEAGTSTTIAKDVQIGVKGTNLFWLSEDKSMVYAYDLISNEVKVSELGVYDPSSGDRPRVHFEGVEWDVIVGAESFSFYSDQTGEVFSDDDGSLAEALRQKLDLDKILNTEQMSNLNLPTTVEASSTIEQ